MRGFLDGPGRGGLGSKAWRGFVAVAVLPLLLVLRPVPGAGQGSEGTAAEGALFLLLPVGAQGVAVGRAMTTVAGGESAFWNPAGMAAVDRSRVVLFRGDHLVGPSTAFSGILSRPGVGALAASYLLLDAGELDQRDANGNYTGTITVRNHLGVLTAATRLFERLALGVNFKVVQFRQSCRGICPDAGTTATTYAIDAGLQGAPLARTRLGVMVAHVGPRLQVLNAEQADPLPSRIRLAVAYDLLDALAGSDVFSGWVSVEVQDRLSDLGSRSLFLGTEVVAGREDAIALRAGYVLSDLGQEDGARVGLGLRYERFDLSIAKSLVVSSVTQETEPVHVTLAIAL